MNQKPEAFFQLMDERCSVRAFDTDAEIPADHERMIIATAQRSSTSCNLQTYTFLSIHDRQTRAALAEVSGGQKFILDAGLFFVACADLYKMEVVTRRAGYDYYQSRFLESFLMAAMDTAIAAQTAAVAAEALGYGICMIGAIRNHVDQVIEILELPPKIFPLIGLCVGVPRKLNPTRPRLPLEGVLFRDRYDRGRVEAAIDDYDRTMRETGCYCGREFSSDTIERIAEGPQSPEGGYGWIEHSARRVASHKAEDVRSNLSEVLRLARFGLE